MEVTALSEICRTCLSGNGVEMYALHENTLENECLDDILLNCCAIQSDDKELPGKICMECKSVLWMFYKFKQRCQANDVLLRSYIKENISQLTDTSTGNKENTVVVDNISEQHNALSSCASASIESVEFNTELYVCQTCGKSFNKQKNLYRHRKIHDDKRQYLCATCGKGFVQWGNLQSHMRIHSGARPYACDLCSKSFAQWSTLRGHLASHSGDRAFVCSVCGKQFTRNSALSKHMNTHTAERQYTCHLCNKKFKNASERVRHLVVHTGEKKHACTVCGKAFNRASNLSVHEKLHADKTRDSYSSMR